MNIVVAKLKSVWRAIRRLSGDDAYERYLAHYAAHHQPISIERNIERVDMERDSALEQPLSKEEFFRQWQDSKWKGVKRCC